MGSQLTIGELASRTGVATSALRFYEDQGLIHADRAESGHRRYQQATLRRVSFIKIAQEVGLTLQEIASAMSSLPDSRTPNQEDWARLSASWRPRLDDQIAMLERLRDRLDSCIGCGCLSLRKCAILNPGDIASERGPGPRYIIEDY
jgi:MerR family transcriptional regulator, redox-sensitive transcriptional activator SoxR